MTRPEKAKALFKEGYNCSQSVLLAFADCFEINVETLSAISAGFGGGMGRLREVCGAFSGAVMLAGLKQPFESGNYAQKKDLYQTVQAMAEEFCEQNGSIICRELLNLSAGKDSPAPSERTENYYKKRPCAEIVAIAAEIAEKQLGLCAKTE